MFEETKVQPPPKEPEVEVPILTLPYAKDIGRAQGRGAAQAAEVPAGGALSDRSPHIVDGPAPQAQTATSPEGYSHVFLSDLPEK